MNNCLQTAILFEWMVKRKITLIQKDLQKEQSSATKTQCLKYRRSEKKYINRLYAVNYFWKNKDDVAGKLKEQITYYI